MEVVKVDFKNTKGIPPSGLCVGVHRAGAMHQKMVEKHGDGIAVWSLRPENDFIAFKSLEDEEGIRSTNDMDTIKDEKLIYGVRGAPPEVRRQAKEQGLELLADATCPFVVQQEEAELELLDQGCHLVILSSRSHHGIPRLMGIAKEKEREVFIVEKEEDVADIRLTRFEPVGVIVQTTFWMDSYTKIMTRLLERFANVRIRNTACIDSLQRLPKVEALARDVEAVVIFGWTEGMTNRMEEVAKTFNGNVYRIEKIDDLERSWFTGMSRVGIVGANETTDELVDEAVERIKSMAA